MIHLPFDSPDIARILADLNADAARLAALQRRNVREAALRHDWVYRIGTIFDVLKLAADRENGARAARSSPACLTGIKVTFAQNFWQSGHSRPDERMVNEVTKHMVNEFMVSWRQGHPAHFS